MKRILIFTGWYPSPDSNKYPFVREQVQILNKYFPILIGEPCHLIVWNQVLSTDIFNHIFRKRASSFFWMDNAIPVLRKQSVIISHRLPIDQDSLVIRKMRKSYKEMFNLLGGEPDVVWCVTLSSAMLWDKFQQYQKMKIPFVLQEHSNPLSMHLKRKWHVIFAKEMLNRVSEVIVVAGRQFKEFKDLYEDVQPVLIWNTVAEYFLENDMQSVQGGKFVFLFVGRISEEKGLMRLIRAVKILENLGRDFIVRIVGTGSQESEVKIYSEAHDVSNRLEWLGSKMPEEISSIMNNCHAFILPSLYENCPVALLEAQVKGMPCICTINGASEKVLLPGNGIAVDDDGSGSGLAGAMHTIMDTYTTFYRNEIRERSLKEFSPEVFSKKMAEVFKRAWS